MNKKEFVDYKRERLKEISKVIKESGERMNPQWTDIEELQDKLERLKSAHPWLK